jgi:hypothetical protein
MTACLKLARAVGLHAEQLCTSCVYFSRNLDTREYPVLMQEKDQCGLGFLPGDGGCAEMRSDCCSVRKRAD